MITLEIPEDAQISGTVTFSKVTTIQANKDISIVSVNSKAFTSEASIVYPVEEWGTEYYIVTPNNGPPEGLKEFCVINNQETNNINIYLKGAVIFDNLLYPAGTTLSVMLKPLQAIQIQSEDDLSGTRIMSSKPSGVLTGHSLTSQNSKGNHVYEQLLPTTSWGNTFIVPAVPFQTKSDFVFIAASKNTRVDFQAGIIKKSQNLVAGQVITLEVTTLRPLYIKATAGIQVILYFTGLTGGYDIINNPFIINIPDVGSYCTSYFTYGLDKFDNYAILVTERSATREITSNKLPLSGQQWIPIEGTDYSWSYFPVGKKLSSDLIEGKSPFMLLNFGVSQRDGYGSLGICIDGMYNRFLTLSKPVSMSAYLRDCLP
ncbi:hypothetical protein NDU88_010644 [Pleurodeles waltl]|uniref:IgGFc-binding protein N-terminal domain-containing protein n=1 Tax=Pleurodeles waltl TaxID=8319 RepID=A0AAV7Q2U7_PLEWA|nr:hypothetical protein NDU88_010644 [Pleurodeles waltl]